MASTPSTTDITIITLRSNGRVTSRNLCETRRTVNFSRLDQAVFGSLAVGVSRATVINGSPFHPLITVRVGRAKSGAGQGAGLTHNAEALQHRMNRPSRTQKVQP